MPLEQLEQKKPQEDPWRRVWVCGCAGHTQLGAEASGGQQSALAPLIMVCFCRGSPARPVLTVGRRHGVIRNLSVPARGRSSLRARPFLVGMQTGHLL